MIAFYLFCIIIWLVGTGGLEACVQKKKNPVGYPLMIFLSIYFCLLLIIIGPDGVESDWIGLFRIKAQDRSSVSLHKRNKKCS